MHPCHEAKYGAPHQTPCLIGSASKQIFCASYLTLKMTSDQKSSTWKLFVSSKRSRFLLGSFPSEVVCHHKKDPQSIVSLNRTVLESLDKTNPNLPRALDMNPNLFLTREVLPPLIYLRGDGRLNNTQSINSSTTFIFYLFSLTLVLLLPRSSFVLLLQGGEPRGPRGGQADLGQPIAATRPDGVPPGRVGFRVY